MRAMWKGAISFGLVTIPVKLYAATEEKDLHFKQLHKRCGTPIRYKKFCPTCEMEVEADQIIKGYEIEKESYVTLEEEELESIPVAASRTLEIVDFISLAEIDPVFYDRTYYLEPGDGGSKPYALLRRAMEETGRIAVAKVVMRSKESLAAIRVFREGVLALETMHFPDEVRSPAGLKGIVEPELRPQELQMAKSLVLSLSAPFEPGKYQNEYRDAVLELISAKAHGVQPVESAAEPKAGRVVDLMDALRASIQAAEAERGVAAGAAEAPVEPAVAAVPAVAPPAAPAAPLPTAPVIERPAEPAAAAVPTGIPTIIIPGLTLPAAAHDGAPAVVPSVAAPVAAPAPAVPAVAAAPAPAAAAAPSAPMAPTVDRPAPPTVPAAAQAPNLFGAEPPAVQPTAARVAASAPPTRRPTAPLTVPGGRRPLPPAARRPLPPGAIGQSVWQYRPEL